MHVIDISNPASPALAGSYNSPGTANVPAIEGDYAIIPDYPNGLQVIDISDPTTPTLATSFTTTGDPHMAAVAGDYIYVAAQPTGLQVVQFFQRTMSLSDSIGQSTDINPFADSILEARLSTAQNDTITWEMSADGGSNWQAIVPDGEWNQLAINGTDFSWRSAHRPPNLRTNPTCTSLQFDFMFEFPQVDAIEDIPNDQGRQVSISWTRSGNDYVGSGTPITEYAIYRKIDPDLYTPRVGLERDIKPVDPRYKVNGDMLIKLLPPGSWHFIMTVPALAEDDYATVVPTLADSTISEGMYYSTFIVLALTVTPGVYFESPPDSGYSLDNLAPNVPEGFSVAYNTGSGNQLAWEPASDEDFRYNCIYRSTNPDFTPAPEDLVQVTVASEWLDPVGDGWQYYYKISAVDFAGNESDHTGPGTTTGITDDIIPKAFALYQNLPNPFNPTTLIRYNVPEGGGHVTLRVYDVCGRLVKTLADGPQTAGEKRVLWHGRNEQGGQVATGVYFYRMTAPGFEMTRKMVLLQ
jgi:hypothetical protein